MLNQHREIMDNSKTATLMHFNQVGTAEIYKSLLEANGIRASLNNDIIHSILPIGATNTLSILLIVLEEDAAKAREILSADFDKEEFAKETR